MSTYVIGDLQGCFKSLQALLEKMHFNRAKDRLWFVGDLVNRGPHSLECLRFVKELGVTATVVLGNHDLHLLAVDEDIARAGKSDTLAPILAATDRNSLMDWLRQRPLLHIEDDFVLVHAGLPPQWSLSLAKNMAGELETALRGNSYRAFLKNMYGNEPARWREELSQTDRLRFAINAMTRMRIVNDDGDMDLQFKGGLRELPDGMSPWFDRLHVSFATKTIVAGHWSALGLHLSPNAICLDTGCVWGRDLTAVRLEDRMVIQVPCADTVTPPVFE
jgi:bis(5'-nucleosyl)-tetraphosphatase (symmetrical)